MFVAVIVILIGFLGNFCESMIATPARRELSVLPPHKSRTLLGPFLVHLDKATTNHESFEMHLQELQDRLSPHLKYDAKITHRFHHVSYGLVVEGMTKTELESLPGVKRVIHDTTKRIRAYSWGIDRINQADLPLDYSVAFDYSGLGVNVYVVDTGIDTAHFEFAGNNRREVANIYSAFVANSKKHNPGANIDDQGHGTHVSGTIGGKTIGVAKDANLYGLKILDADGEGSTSDILEALDYVHVHRSQHGNRPAVVSMSLGGECETDDCSEDSLVQAAETLVGLGIAVSVAAGNEGCNACSGSPNAAPNAINVGASDRNDHVTYFSNFGQCIDVFAPGMDILSACASVVCEDQKSYVELSGTSMACPHVTGVVALLLQKKPSATPASILKALTCDGAPGRLYIDERDTISRDILLQAPRQSTGFADCDEGGDCPAKCNDNGVCLPYHSFPPDYYQAVGRNLTVNKDTCHCNGGYYGESCSLTTDPLCLASHNTLSVDMKDTFGDGWTFTNYVITSTETGEIVDGAYNSLCYGSDQTAKYCLPDGCYQLDVSRGPFPGEVAWSTCGNMAGGAPYSGQFCFENGVCKQSCHSGSVRALHLKDSYGDGWGGYYAIYSAVTGSQIYGGTLPNGRSGTHNLCFPMGCSILYIEMGGKFPNEISYEVCGKIGTAQDFLSVCIDENFQCTATILGTPDGSCLHNSVPLYLFNSHAQGWGGASYRIENAELSVSMTGTLNSGFYGTEKLCLPDGCFDFQTLAGSADSKTAAGDFWSLCEFRGSTPWHSRVCLEQRYDLCYGVSGCPFVKTYSRASDYNFLIVSHIDKDLKSSVVDLSINAHGVHDLCLEDASYNVIVGGGSTSSGLENGKMTICDVETTVPIMARVTIANNSTSCEVTFQTPTCAASTVLNLFIKLDQGGDGWNNGKYTIQKPTSKNPVTVATGTLTAGSVGVDPLCLNFGECYTLTVKAGQYADEILWALCGYVGGAPIDSEEFCITDSGCEFQSLSDDDSYYYYDDDGSNDDGRDDDSNDDDRNDDVSIDDDWSDDGWDDDSNDDNRNDDGWDDDSNDDDWSDDSQDDDGVSNNDDRDDDTNDGDWDDDSNDDNSNNDDEADDDFPRRFSFHPTPSPIPLIPTAFPTIESTLSDVGSPTQSLTTAPTLRPTAKPTLLPPLVLSASPTLPPTITLPIGSDVRVLSILISAVVKVQLTEDVAGSASFEDSDLDFLTFAVQHSLKQSGYNIWSAFGRPTQWSSMDVSSTSLIALRKLIGEGSRLFQGTATISSIESRYTISCSIGVSLQVPDAVQDSENLRKAVALNLESSVLSGNLDASVNAALKGLQQKRKVGSLTQMISAQLASLETSQEAHIDFFAEKDRPAVNEEYHQIFPADDEAEAPEPIGPSTTPIDYFGLLIALLALGVIVCAVLGACIWRSRAEEEQYKKLSVEGSRHGQNNTESSEVDSEMEAGQPQRSPPRRKRDSLVPLTAEEEQDTSADVATTMKGHAKLIEMKGSAVSSRPYSVSTSTKSPMYSRIDDNQDEDEEL